MTPTLTTLLPMSSKPTPPLRTRKSRGNSLPFVSINQTQATGLLRNFLTSKELRVEI
ncbi:hypothetical protein BDM02DRAFT_1938011 [Thelephora ganbajun]|uniref:Uncharacterized protein n=1 Tax=Thelephora ganbajun TaxID=370292 RepID=A0ACB6ZIC7_THEGA|nr:hypothetical protein BDM02DRAFT_1938011 [Thelephora ganbajun]